MNSLHSDSIHAAIDIGTNSMHLLIARLNESGGLDIRQTERQSTRLGSGMGTDRMLTSEAIERGIETLGRFNKIALSQGATVSALATSAVREARNQHIFLERAKRELGVKVEIISGVEEARLIHTGVLQALEVYEKRIFVFDIGGGSSELVIGQRGEPLAARSLKIGCIKLTDRFFPEGHVTEKAVTECRNYVRSFLAAVKSDFTKYLCDVVVGCSGTVNAIAQIIAKENGYPLRQLNGATFTANDLHTLADRILQLDISERRKIDGLEDRRVDIITGGIVLLSEMATIFGFKEITVSEYALREGILFDRLATGSVNVSTNLRSRNVEQLSQQLDPDPVHAKNVALLALQLFDQTSDLHGLGKNARDLLNMSAQLHNVGLSISHSAHHKHSYYVIRHSDSLTGFTEREIEVMALIARYHRRSKPSAKQQRFANLEKDDQYTVGCLAGILRIAIGLDRRHSGVVVGMEVAISQEGAVTIFPETEMPNSIDLEIYAANARASLLEDIFDTTVSITSRD